MNPKNLVCTWYILIRFESFKFEKKPGKSFFFKRRKSRCCFHWTKTTWFCVCDRWYIMISFGWHFLNYVYFSFIFSHSTILILYSLKIVKEKDRIMCKSQLWLVQLNSRMIVNGKTFLGQRANIFNSLTLNFESF